MIQRIVGKTLIQWHRDYQTVFSTPAGKRVLADLIRTAGVNRSSFTAGQPDTVAYNEGKRAIVLRILNRLHVAPEEVARIAQEYAQNG